MRRKGLGSHYGKTAGHALSWMDETLLVRGDRRTWKTAFGAGVFPAMKSSAFHPPDPPFFNFHNEVGNNSDGEDSSP